MRCTRCGAEWSEAAPFDLPQLVRAHYETAHELAKPAPREGLDAEGVHAAASYAIDYTEAMRIAGETRMPVLPRRPPANRVRVKGAHGIRGEVQEVQAPHNGPMAGIWVQVDGQEQATLYLASELESETKPCACFWCAPEAP